MSSSNGVAANSATMDYTKWAEMQQNPNPNPNSDPSLSNYSATYYHDPSYPYQQYLNTGIDPNSALLQSLPQPTPPGVDPTPQAVTYAQPPVSYEPHQGAAVAAAPYYPDPNVSWQPDPNVTWQPDPNVSWQHDPNVSWQHDPNVNWQHGPNASWPVAITHFGAPTYAAGVTAPNRAIRPQRSKPPLKRNVTKKPIKVVQSAWCEVCKVACNTKEILYQHQSGKKHKKNVEKLKVTSKSLPGPATFAIPPPYVATPPAIVATLPAIVATPPANVAISTSAIVATPPANVATSTAIVAIPPPNVATSAAAIVAIPPPNVATSAAAIVAIPPPNVATSTAAVVATPPANVATSTAAVVATPPVSVATSSAIVDPSAPLPVATLVSTDKPIIGPENKRGKPKTSKSKNKAKSLKRRAAASLAEDLETKKRKVMEGGVPENNVRACSICNVVCNSAMVFDTHLAGQKHAAMVKKHMSMPGVAPAM